MLICIANVLILQINTLLILIPRSHPLVCHPRLWSVLILWSIFLSLRNCPLIPHRIDRSASFFILSPRCKVLFISGIPDLLHSLISPHLVINKFSIKISLPLLTMISLSNTTCPPMRIRLLFKVKIPPTLFFLPTSNQLLRLHLPLLLLPSINHRRLMLHHIPIQPQLIPNYIGTIIILKHLLILNLIFNSVIP